jgi:hypothetical protein
MKDDCELDFLKWRKCREDKETYCVQVENPCIFRLQQLRPAESLIEPDFHVSATNIHNLQEKEHGVVTIEAK